MTGGEKERVKKRGIRKIDGVLRFAPVQIQKNEECVE